MGHQNTGVVCRSTPVQTWAHNLESLSKKLFQERISKLQQDNKELHGFVARSRKSSADSRRSSADTQITIKQLQADIEELKKTNSEVQTANTEMYQNLCKKSEEVKSLEVSLLIAGIIS